MAESATGRASAIEDHSNPRVVTFVEILGSYATLLISNVV